MSSEDRGDESAGALSTLFATQARSRILDFFLDHKEFDYPVSEIATKAGLSFRTVLRELPKLESLGLVIQNRKVGNAAMYRLETNLPAIDLLDRLSLELSRMPSFHIPQKKTHHFEDIEHVIKQTGESDALMEQVADVHGEQKG